MESLERFVTAQAQTHGGVADAVQELGAGRKRGHWIWYVFPQLAGLGSSETSRRFGLRDHEETEAYLRNDTLRDAYARAVGVVTEQLCRLQPPRLEDLMGSRVDALKLVSSLTLFETVADDLATRDSDAAMRRLAEQIGDVLAVAESQDYERCAFTREQLGARRSA